MSKSICKCQIVSSSSIESIVMWPKSRAMSVTVCPAIDSVVSAFFFSKIRTISLFPVKNFYSIMFVSDSCLYGNRQFGGLLPCSAARCRGVALSHSLFARLTSISGMLTNNWTILGLPIFTATCSGVLPVSHGLLTSTQPVHYKEYENGVSISITQNLYY